MGIRLTVMTRYDRYTGITIKFQTSIDFVDMVKEIDSGLEFQTRSECVADVGRAMMIQKGSDAHREIFIFCVEHSSTPYPVRSTDHWIGSSEKIQNVLIE